MSRTFKTDPAWVYPLRIDKHPKMRVREVHNHERGVCDLPDTVPKDACAWLKTNCWYDLDFNGTGTCGCNLCTDHHWRKEEREKSRREGKKYAKRDWQKEY